KLVKEEKRYELVLSGEDVNKRIERQGGLDPAVYELTQLNFLRISKSPLTSLEDSISVLDNLTSLILQANNLGKLPETIGKLQKLKILDVSFNCLEGLPDSISQLSSLATLNACSNKICVLPNIEGCVNLSILDLGHNNLEKFPNICHENLLHLSDVKLNDNQITDVSPNLPRLASLKILDLGNNALKTVPGEVADCARLK
ncbi:B3/4 domain, partial [Halocaridina rubra]